MQKIVITFLFFLVSAVSSYAATLHGEGWGKTTEEAKRSALSDLATAILVEVKSEFIETAAEKNGIETNEVKSVITVESNLPILGAEFIETPSKDGVRVKALLDPLKAAELYKTKLEDIRRNMEETLFAAKGDANAAARHELISSLLTLFEQYKKYRTIGILIGTAKTPEPPITEAEVKKLLYDMEDTAGSIALLAAALTRGINAEKIYISPPIPNGSHEVTPFARAVRDAISARIKTVLSPDNADYIMTGRYEMMKNGFIEIAYSLSKINGDTLKTSVTRLDAKGYEGYETKPLTINLEQLIRDGFAVSNDFRVDLSTSLGRDNPMFRGGEEVELLVKSNQPAYFYITVHVIRSDSQYSYILDINNAEGGRRFVRFINADDVNKWVSLGRFEASPPFGVENLQLISSTVDLADHIPPIQLDKTTGLYMISRKPEEGVNITRGLKPKREKNVLSTEAALTITTMEK